jgi:TPR repeat protein
MRFLLILLVPCSTLLASTQSVGKDMVPAPQGQLRLKALPLAAPAPADDPASVLSRLQAKAEAGDLESQAALGIMYYWGQGAPLDWNLAQQWLRKASERGHRDAQAKLGAMCFLGQGCAANEAEAIHWFQKAAEQGEPYSQGCIGVMYAVGEGVPKDLMASYVWLYQAQAGGDPDAAEPLEQVKKKLTPNQIQEGTRRAEAAMRERGSH